MCSLSANLVKGLGHHIFLVGKLQPINTILLFTNGWVGRCDNDDLCVLGQVQI